MLNITPLSCFHSKQSYLSSVKFLLKAILYWKENIIMMCLDAMKENVQAKRRGRLEKERIRYLRAGMFQRKIASKDMTSINVS